MTLPPARSSRDRHASTDLVGVVLVGVGGVVVGVLGPLGALGVLGGFVFRVFRVFRVFGFAGVGGVVLGVGVGVGSFLAEARGWDVRRSLSVLARRTAGSGTTLARSGLVAGAGWRVMCAAARLMPRAAGGRWLAEAESFLAEAPPAQRRPAIRCYLITAPQVITVTWVGDLARRARGMKRAAR